MKTNNLREMNEFFINKKQKWSISSISVILLLLVVYSCSRTSNGAKSLACVLPEGTRVGLIKSDGSYELINAPLLKANIMQVAAQFQKVYALKNQNVSDSLISPSAEIIYSESEYYLRGQVLTGKENSFSFLIPLQKDKDNNLTISLQEKTIEGCFGNHCSSCKLTKGKGCSCNGNGQCDHIVLEVPFPF